MAWRRVGDSQGAEVTPRGYELKEWYYSGTSLAVAALQTYTVPVMLQLALLIPLYYLSRWLFGLGNTIHQHRGFPRTLLLEVQLVLLLLLSVVMVRGGVQSVPLEPLHAQEIGDNHRAVLALNGSYNALFSSITPYSISPVFASTPTAEEQTLVKALLRNNDAPLTVTPRPKANVIFVLLESWSGAWPSPRRASTPRAAPHRRRQRHGRHDRSRPGSRRGVWCHAHQFRGLAHVRPPRPRPQRGRPPGDEQPRHRHPFHHRLRPGDPMRPSNRGGFTVIEVLIAVVVLAIGIVALVSSSASSTRMIGRGRSATRAVQAAT